MLFVLGHLSGFSLIGCNPCYLSRAWENLCLSVCLSVCQLHLFERLSIIYFCNASSYVCCPTTISACELNETQNILKELITLQVAILHAKPCLFVFSSVCLFVCLFVHFSVYLSVFMNVCSSVCVSICLSVCPSVCLSVCPSVCLASWLSVCPSVCLASWLSVCPSVCLSVCLSVSSLFLFVNIFLICYTKCLEYFLATTLGGYTKHSKAHNGREQLL